MTPWLIALGTFVLGLVLGCLIGHNWAPEDEDLAKIHVDLARLHHAVESIRADLPSRDDLRLEPPGR